MADWLNYDPNSLPWMRRSGEAAQEATAQFQFGAQMAQRREEQRTEEAYKERVLRLQKDTLDLKKASELQMGEGMVEVGRVLSEIAINGDWTNPQARAKFFGVIARYPSITKSQIYDDLLQNFQAADNAKSLMEREKLRAEKGFSPGPLQKDMEYYQQVLSEGDPELIDLTRSILQSKAQKSGFSVKFGQGGTVESVDYGPQAKIGSGAVPTVAFKTKLQEQLANDAGTVELLTVMQNNMTEADFGMRGVARDFKVRIGGQLGLDVEDEDLTVRKSIPLLRASLQKALKTDSNITEAERQDIKRALPSESWLESRKNAEESLRVLVPWLRNRARRSASGLGVDVPIWAMTADEIRSAYKANKISEAEALEAIQKFNIELPSP